MQLNCPSKGTSLQFIISLQINENLFLSKMKLRTVYRTVIGSCASTAYRQNTLFPNGLLNPCNCQQRKKNSVGIWYYMSQTSLFLQQSVGPIWSLCPSAFSRMNSDSILRKLGNINLLMQFTLITKWIRSDHSFPQDETSLWMVIYLYLGWKIIESNENF